ncbi:membrane protein [Gordonia phage Hexbug]|nr:membrane protein [Gordonia phage Hexbug]
MYAVGWALFMALIVLAAAVCIAGVVLALILLVWLGEELYYLLRAWILRQGAWWTRRDGE